MKVHIYKIGIFQRDFSADIIKKRADNCLKCADILLKSADKCPKSADIHLKSADKCPKCADILLKSADKKNPAASTLTAGFFYSNNGLTAFSL